MQPDAVLVVAVSAIITALAGLIVAITVMLRMFIQDREMRRTQEHLEHIDRRINGNSQEQKE